MLQGTPYYLPQLSPSPKFAEFWLQSLVTQIVEVLFDLYGTIVNINFQK